MKNISLAKLKDGDRIKCLIGGTSIKDAKLRIENGVYFICQNKKDGSKPKNRLGYRYSWEIYNIRGRGDCDRSVLDQSVTWLRKA